MIRPAVGFVAWLHFEDEAAAVRQLELLDRLGVRLLRTGFSWADHERLDADGIAWSDHVMHDLLGPRIRSGQLEVLFDFLYTPWKQSREKADGRRTTASPPKRLCAYGDFIARMIERYGTLIGDVELLNEMDIPMEWDREFDWQWHKLARTLRHAGAVVHRHGRRAILGGTTRAEPVLLERLSGPRLLGRDALRHLDVVGLHGFPGTWDSSVTHPDSWRWRGWGTEIGLTREALRKHGRMRPIWVTETGASTYGDAAGTAQLRAFEGTHAALAALGVERMYWYGLENLGQDRATINHLISGESRESNPHSHFLGLGPALLAHLQGGGAALLEPPGGVR